MGPKSTSIIVKGVPVAKLRQRFGKGHAYTPKKTADQEELIKWEYLRQGRTKFDGPLEVKCWFIYEPPKSISKKRRAAMIGTPRTAKPDNDNLVKLCLDALNGIAYTDDNRIWKITSQKVYGEEAMTIILIKETEINE